MKFVSIDGPNSTATIASAINSRGEIVGRYTDTSGGVHAFLIGADGALSTIDVDIPGARNTIARGINDRGWIVGQYTLPEPRFPFLYHGFIRRDGTFTTLDYPMGEGTHTFAWNLNDAGVVVGTFQHPSDAGLEHGFAHDDGRWTPIDYPGARKTFATSIDSQGRILGTWHDGEGIEHGFLLMNGTFSELNVRDAKSAFFDQLLDDGTTSGVYTDAATGSRRAFIRDRRGRVTTINHPGVTVARGINARGDIVGRYVDATNGNKERGYVIWGGLDRGGPD